MNGGRWWLSIFCLIFLINVLCYCDVVLLVCPGVLVLCDVRVCMSNARQVCPNEAK